MKDGLQCPLLREPIRRPSCALEVEPARDTVQCLIGNDRIAPVCLLNAVLELRPLLNRHSIVERCGDGSLVEFSHDLLPFGWAERAKHLDDLGLGTGHIFIVP